MNKTIHGAPSRQMAGAVLLLAALILAGTAESVYARPMDWLSVVWFGTLATFSTIGIVITIGAMRAPFRRSQRRTSFDEFAWGLFIALPIFISLFLIGVWTLGWHFLGWNS